MVRSVLPHPLSSISCTMPGGCVLSLALKGHIQECQREPLWKLHFVHRGIYLCFISTNTEILQYIAKMFQTKCGKTSRKMYSRLKTDSDCFLKQL